VAEEAVVPLVVVVVFPFANVCAIVSAMWGGGGWEGV